MIRFLEIVFLLFVPICLCYPQSRNLRFEHLTVEQGLSQSTVRCILQDSQGFMWFGTEDGLNRYDGYAFKVFKPEPNNKFSISHISVWALFEDSNNNLWVGTQGGLNKYDRSTEHFIRYKSNPLDSTSLSSNIITSICEDDSGALWIGTWGGGLNKLLTMPAKAPSSNIQAEQFIHFRHDPQDSNSISHDVVIKIIKDHAGVLWVGTQDGLNKCLPNSQFGQKTSFEHYRYQKNHPKSSNDNFVLTLFEDSQNRLWIGTWGAGAYLLDANRTNFYHYQHKPGSISSISDDEIWSICEDMMGRIWFATDGGADRFDPELEAFDHFKAGDDNHYALAGNNIRSVYSDGSGIVWIGSQGKGLYKVDLKGKKFNHFYNRPKMEYSLIDNAIFAFFEDTEQRLWVGTEKGLDEYDKDDQKFYHYYFSIDPNANKIRSLHQAKSDPGVMWVGTAGAGLARMDISKANRIVRGEEPTASPPIKYFRQDNLKNNYIHCILEDKQGNLLVGTQSGLMVFDREKQILSAHRVFADDRQSTISAFVWTLLEDTKGNLWIGTGGTGIKMFDKIRQKILSYEYNPDNPNSLSHNIVKSIYESANGTFWIGTRGGGLNKYLPEEQNFKHFTEKDGLASNVVYGILEDKHGFLWLSTNNGLSKFDPRTEEFRNFDKYDGLQNNEFNGGAFLKTKGGMMLFGGIDGYNMFDPEMIQDNPHIPNLVFTNFRKVNELQGQKFGQFSKESITAASNIHLSHRDNVFSFEFAALDYTTPEKNQYAYKMEGFDKNWIYSGTRRTATYTNLSPGDYIFRVRGSNNDGIWNEDGISLKISISPPWWRSYPAYFLYFLLAIYLLYWARHYELKRASVRNELEMQRFESQKMHELDRMKSRFFANISHEFRTPLTLIQGPVKQLLSGEFKGDVKELYRKLIKNSNRLLNLINQILDLSKLESGKMALHVRKENIIPILKGLVESFESMAVQKKIALKFMAQESTVEVYIDRNKIENIINNLLSNAFKFTPQRGMVEVAIKHPPQSPLESGETHSLLKKGDKGGCIEITVSNSGAGIPADQINKIFDRFFQADVLSNGGKGNFELHQGSGIGLALCQELVKLHHGQIYVQSLPLKKTSPDSTNKDHIQVRNEYETHAEDNSDRMESELYQTVFTVLLPLGRKHLKDEDIEKRAEHIEPETNHIPDLILEDGFPYHISTGQKIPNKKQQTQNALVLVVEDNADVRQYIRSDLENNFRILEANNGRDGLQKATSEIPDLVISDVMMPGMDGYEFCRHLKSDERTSHVPVILLTARAAQEDKIEGLETGADDFITKPFDTEELKVRIKNLISQRRKLRDCFSKNVAGRGEIEFGIQYLTVSSTDEKFLQRALAIVKDHLSDFSFTIDSFAREVGMSSRQLHRKFKAVTDQTPVGFIRAYRLKQASNLLQNKFGNVTEIAYEVGFKNPAYFAECFRKYFGVSPSQYVPRQDSAG